MLDSFVSYSRLLLNLPWSLALVQPLKRSTRRVNDMKWSLTATIIPSTVLIMFILNLNK